MNKIMIIDDELNILEVLNKFLSRSGKLEVETYSNPLIALKKISTKKYDLVLSDIMMPQLDGLDILKNIKESDPKIKVILMTAYNTNYTKEKSIKFNADNYIEKPFKNLKFLEETILETLGK